MEGILGPDGLPSLPMCWGAYNDLADAPCKGNPSPLYRGQLICHTGRNMRDCRDLAIRRYGKIETTLHTPDYVRFVDDRAVEGLNKLLAMKQNAFIINKALGWKEDDWLHTEMESQEMADVKSTQNQKANKKKQPTEVEEYEPL